MKKRIAFLMVTITGLAVGWLGAAAMLRPIEAALNGYAATSIRFCPGLNGVHRGDTLLVATSGIVCVSELHPAPAPPPTPTPTPTPVPPTPVPPTPVPPTPVPPTPTPPPVSGSHEPAGLTQLASNQFTHTPPVGQGVPFTGEAPWSINNPGQGSSPGYATLAPGGGLEYVYRGGQNQEGGSPATTYFDPSPAPHTLYMRATITVSMPYTVPSNGHQKILNGGGLFLMLNSGQTLLVETELPSDNANYYASAPFVLGVPHVVEWLIDAVNGLTKVWQDGVLVITTPIKFPAGWTSPEPQLYGGFSSSAPAQDQFMIYQNVYVSGR